jgi:hypothetical protein
MYDLRREIVVGDYCVPITAPDSVRPGESVVSRARPKSMRTGRGTARAAPEDAELEGAASMMLAGLIPASPFPSQSRGLARA